MSRSVDITGMRFGRLTAVQMTTVMGGRQKWRFRCDCRNEIEANKGNVVSGKTASCGCLRIERTVERSTTHGHTVDGKESPEYTSWCRMRQRCGNPKFKDFANWGGRAITIDPRSNDFASFS